MKMLINGKWVDKPEKINVVNPYDDTLVDTVPAGTADDVEKAIESAVEGFIINRDLPVHRRISILKKTSEIMESRFDELAKTIATEGSKTIKEARKEVERAINTITISAEEARRLNGETIPFDSAEGSENRVGYYYRFPIGVIAAITPFNDPLNLVAHKLGPAIAGGNSVVLKPAQSASLSLLQLARLAMEAGIPKGVLNVVTGSGSVVGEALGVHPDVDVLAFTGSGVVGRRLLNYAAQSNLKRVHLELGGKSPNIVFADAPDIEAAVATAINGIFRNSGQVCTAGSRLLVQETIYEEFLEKVISGAEQLVVGDPLDPATDIGAVHTLDQLKNKMNSKN